jgi:hypothetical protein
MSPSQLSSDFLLYGTSACHLCEDAAELLSRLPEQYIKFESIDISDSDLLLNRYGLRIPVLHHKASGKELDWPFDQARLLSFLNDTKTAHQT